MRLQKFLAQAGVSSRRQAESLIKGGAVSVNGQAVTTLGTSISEGSDRVEVNGRRVFIEKPIYRLLLKPRACLATLQPSGNRTTLRRFLREPEAGLFQIPEDFRIVEETPAGN